MPKDVVMPRLGWTMEAGTVVEWLKVSGDPVEAGEMLFSVESDKAITEVEALDSGVLYLPPDAPIGVEVPVGARVGFILAPGEERPAVTSPRATSDMAHGADRRPPAAALLANPSAHAGGKLTSAVSPRARRIASELGVDLEGVAGTGREGRIRESDVRAAAVAKATNGVRPRVSPSVRRMAEESGIDLALVSSSRPASRVTRADLLAAASPLGSLAPSGMPMSAFRRAISHRMSETVRTVAPVTLTTEANATELVNVRESLKREPLSSSDPLPSYNDLLIRLVARAIRLHPLINASIEGDFLVVHDEVHIGLAVDTDRGLLAPVVRNADVLGTFDIARESNRLISATRDGSIGGEELTGGTFTITNLGMYDIDTFTPIINLPECAVLGVGRIVAKPVVVNEDTELIVVRKMMALSLTFDHRVIDGAPAARFLQQVKGMVAQPLRWLM